MKVITRTALLAITTASIGVGALAPAFAQPFGGNNNHVQRIEGGEARSFRPDFASRFGPAHRGGMILDMLVSGRGAEAIDIAAVRLTHQLDLTQDQQALLEDLRLAALDAQTNVQSARDDIAPVSEDEADQPDLIARYAGMVAMTTARAEALEAIQPSFEAFVQSLDDAQIDKLMPGRPTQPAANANG